MGLRVLCAAAVALSLAAPALAKSSVRDLARVLHLAEVVSVMRDEGLSHSEDLDRDMLDGTGGAYWRSEIDALYDTSRMEQALIDAFDESLSDDDIDQSIAFFATEQGQKILKLETAARVAMADPEVETIARGTYDDLNAGDDPRLAATRRFVEVNDLLDRNVLGTMESNAQFYRGLVDGGAIKMDDATILSDVWEQEEELRADTEGWLFGFLLMAYRPLEMADLNDYIAFSETPAGQALNDALFEGFDRMFGDISYQLGRSVGRAMSAQDL